MIGTCLQGHASKNSGGQLTTSLRTLWYGSFWVDMQATLSHGMPPVAFGRLSEMSDRMQAILQNPFYLVKSVAARKVFIYFYV